MNILFSEATSLHSRTLAHTGLVVAFEKSFTEAFEILAQQWEFCYEKKKEKEKKKKKGRFYS